jgi:hypothetical protein
MQGSAIRTIRTARNAPIAATAFFERTVQIWDWKTGDRLSELDTVFYFGGYRLTVSPAGETCIAANWKKGQRGGVACYETRSGRKIWHRTDLRQVQGLRFSSQDDAVWCIFGDRPVQRLDAKTGSTVETLRTIQDVVDSPFSAHRLQLRRTGFQIVGSESVSVPRLTPAMLAAAFSPDSLCLSEACGPVRCLEVESGRERWRYLPPAGHHVLAVSSQGDQSFCCVQWGYSRGGRPTLIRLAYDTGKCTEVCSLDSWGDACCFGADVVITSSGDVVSLSKESIIRRLAFPKREYPDPKRSSSQAQ